MHTDAAGLTILNNVLTDPLPVLDLCMAIDGPMKMALQEFRHVIAPDRGAAGLSRPLCWADLRYRLGGARRAIIQEPTGAVSPRFRHIGSFDRFTALHLTRFGLDMRIFNPSRLNHCNSAAGLDRASAGCDETMHPANRIQGGAA
jgi:hypothetical protein